jgi:hypothetical protein
LLFLGIFRIVAPSQLSNSGSANASSFCGMDKMVLDWIGSILAPVRCTILLFV